MKKILIATIADVENVLAGYKQRVAANPKLEALDGKKLGSIVCLLKPKTSVPKLLTQAYGYGESKWAKNVLNDNAEGCTKENKLEKITEHILSTEAYKKFIKDTDTKDEAEAWMANDLLELVVN
jgi:hypothetical protein